MTNNNAKQEKTRFFDHFGETGYQVYDF